MRRKVRRTRWFKAAKSHKSWVEQWWEQSQRTGHEAKTGRTIKGVTEQSETRWREPQDRSAQDPPDAKPQGQVNRVGQQDRWAVRGESCRLNSAA